jgi:hypothetical protein
MRIFQWHVRGAWKSNNRFAKGVHSPDVQIGEGDLHLFSRESEFDPSKSEFFGYSPNGSRQVWTLLGEKPSAAALEYLEPEE